MTPEEALEIVLDHLEECGIRFMITGSFASNVHGLPRVTQDADVIIESDLPSLLHFLQTLGADFYRDLDVAKSAFGTNRMLNIIHLPTGFKVDLIVRKERPFSKEEFSRRQELEFLGRPRWFASPEDVVLAKLEWSKIGQSERQFEDAVRVAEVQADSLDRPYLLRWARELGVERLLKRLFSALRRDPASASSDQENGND